MPRGMSEIRRAAKEGRKVKIRYLRKGRGRDRDRMVTRTVTGYERKGRYLYVDHRGRTKSFIASRIQSARIAKTKAEPKYPVKL